MPAFTLDPARSAGLADGLLNAFREVRDLADQKAFVGQYERMADVLRAALAATEEAVALPATTRSPDKETGISRQGIIVAVDAEIERLARLKVSIGLHRSRGDALTVDPARAIVGAAIVIRALLATPTLNPRLEVGDVEHHAAKPFPGA